VADLINLKKDQRHHPSLHKKDNKAHPSGNPIEV
jgi:hypothetical protein